MSGEWEERFNIIHRDIHDIREAVLSACNVDGGVRFTRVMYKSYLSYQQMIDVVAFLKKTELLIVKDDKFVITPKGKEVAGILKELKGMIKK